MKRASTPLALLCALLAALASGCALLGEREVERAANDALARPLATSASRDLEAQRAPLAEAPSLAPATARTEPAAIVEPLGIDQALTRARATSEELRSAGEDLLQAHLARIEALAELLPEVSYRQGYFREENDFPASDPSSGIRFGALLVEQRTGRFEGRLPLFYLSGYLALAQASSVIDVAEARLHAERLLVDQATTALFYTALKAERAIDTLEAARARDLERKREIEARAATGLARRTEVLFVETDLARTDAGLADARERLAATRAQLALLVGAPIRGELVEPRLPPSLDPKTFATRALPELVDEAHRLRPDLAATRAQIDVAEGVLDVALGDYAPRLDVVGNYYLHRDGTLEDVDWDVTVDLSAPLFEGLRTTARAREAQSKKRQAELVYQGQARAIASDVAGAYHALRASWAARVSREESVRSADENFRLLEAEYRLGLASNLELVTAQQQLTEARLAYENERLDEQRLAYDLAFLLGGIERATPAAASATPP